MKSKVILLVIISLTILTLVLTTSKGIEDEDTVNLNLKIRGKILLPNQLAVKLRNNLPIVIEKGKIEQIISIRKVPIKVLEDSKVIKVGEEILENKILKIEGKKIRLIRSSSS